MSSGVFLSFTDLASFSPEGRAEIVGFAQSQLNADPGVPAVESEGEPADLSVAQARKFLDRVSEKVRTALQIIVNADVGGFDIIEVMNELDIAEAGDLRGVWGGMTKRVRTVLGDGDAYLIWWKKGGEGGWIGRVSPMTHRSFRKALDIE